MLFGDSLLYSVLPLRAEDLGIPLLAVGIILSINRWVRLISNSVAARIYDRFGAYKPLMLSAIATVITTFVYAYGTGLLPFLTARVIWGLCWSHLRLASLLTVVATSREVLGLAMGVMHAITRLGSGFTALVGGALVDAYGYSSGMAIMGLSSSLAIPMVVLLRSRLRDDRIAQSVPEKQAAASICPLRCAEFSPLFCNLAAFVNSFVGTGLVVPSLSVVLRYRIGPSVSILGSTLGIATISGMLLAVRWNSNLLLSPLVGTASDFWGRRRTFALLWTLQGLSLLMFAFIASPLSTLIWASLLFLTGNSLDTVLSAAIGDTAQGEGNAARFSIYATYHDLGAACGPLIGYLVGVNIGFVASYFLGFVTMVAFLVARFQELFPLQGGGRGSLGSGSGRTLRNSDSEGKLRGS